MCLSFLDSHHFSKIQQTLPFPSILLPCQSLHHPDKGSPFLHTCKVLSKDHLSGIWTCNTEKECLFFFPKISYHQKREKIKLKLKTISNGHIRLLTDYKHFSNIPELLLSDPNNDNTFLGAVYPNTSHLHNFFDL